MYVTTAPTTFLLKIFRNPTTDVITASVMSGRFSGNVVIHPDGEEHYHTKTIKHLDDLYNIQRTIRGKAYIVRFPDIPQHESVRLTICGESKLDAFNRILNEEEQRTLIRAIRKAIDTQMEYVKSLTGKSDG